MSPQTAFIFMNTSDALRNCSLREGKMVSLQPLIKTVLLKTFYSETEKNYRSTECRRMYKAFK